MKRREFLSATALALAHLRERAAAFAPDQQKNLRWAVSSFLWTSTIWPDQGTLPYTDMLDVIRDTGFNGFRLTGWPGVLDRIGMPLSQLDRELEKRNLTVATISFGGQADDPSQHQAIEKSAHDACRFLQRYGARDLVVFSPRRVNKVLVREHLRVACEFYNRLGDLCASYNIRAGLHNHSQGQLVESQDEIEMLLRWTDPKRFHWCPDTVHLYMANCDILGLFRKYADRLTFFDLVDARYEYAREDLVLPNGKVEKAGTHNATFMLGNRDYGDGEVDLQGIMRILKTHQYKGWINIDHHYARVSPKASFERCRKYIREKLEPIYA